MVCSLKLQSLQWCLGMQIFSVECASGLEISNITQYSFVCGAHSIEK